MDTHRRIAKLAQLAVLNGATSLAEVAPPAPWDRAAPEDHLAALFDQVQFRFAPLIAGAIDPGTETPSEDRYAKPLDTGTDGPPDTGSHTGPGAPSDTGTGTPPKRAKRTGTRHRRRRPTGAGTKTGPKPRTDEEKSLLLERAREINAEHFREHGKPISGDNLAKALRGSKGTALDLLREVKRLREVRPNNGVA